MKSGIVLCGLVAGIGLGGGYLLGHGDSREVRTVVVEPSAPRDVTIRTEGAIDVEQLRAVVREEVARLRAPTPEAPAAAAQPSPSLERAHALVNARLQSGVWTEDDRRALQSELASMTQAEVEEVLATVFPAMNDGRLRLTYDGAPI
jgi:hypothetical protein